MSCSNVFGSIPPACGPSAKIVVDKVRVIQPSPFAAIPHVESSLLLQVVRRMQTAELDLLKIALYLELDAPIDVDVFDYQDRIARATSKSGHLYLYQEAGRAAKPLCFIFMPELLTQNLFSQRMPTVTLNMYCGEKGARAYWDDGGR